MLGDKIEWFLFSSAAINIIIVYTNLFLFVPKLLLNQKFIQYIAVLSVTIVLLIIGDSLFELYVFNLCNIDFEESFFSFIANNKVIGVINTFLISIVSLVAISMTVVFKRWANDKEQIDKLETEELQTKLDTMKEKISPYFLSRILNKAATLAPIKPLKASDILLKLSKVLRYQLYDSNREQVLLTSEIEFLNNFLNLESIYNEKLTFKVEQEGELSHIFIPPLLFLPIINKSIIQYSNNNYPLNLELKFQAIKGRLTFSFSHNNTTEIDYCNLKKRLSLIYKKDVLIDTTPHNQLTVEIEL